MTDSYLDPIATPILFELRLISQSYCSFFLQACENVAWWQSRVRRSPGWDGAGSQGGHGGKTKKIPLLRVVRTSRRDARWVVVFSYLTFTIQRVVKRWSQVLSFSPPAPPPGTPFFLLLRREFSIPNARQLSSILLERMLSHFLSASLFFHKKKFPRARVCTYSRGSNQPAKWTLVVSSFAH